MCSRKSFDGSGAGTGTNGQARQLGIMRLAPRAGADRRAVGPTAGV